MGTQSTFTNFPYLRKIWKTNTEEERLLGVSLTGIMDCKWTNGGKGFHLSEFLEKMRRRQLKQIKMGEVLDIPESKGLRVKPSGTVSQLVDSSSGIHARHSPYYIRTVRGDNKDPYSIPKRAGRP